MNGWFLLILPFGKGEEFEAEVASLPPANVEVESAEGAVGKPKRDKRLTSMKSKEKGTVRTGKDGGTVTAILQQLLSAARETENRKFAITAVGASYGIEEEVVKGIP